MNFNDLWGIKEINKFWLLWSREVRITIDYLISNIVSYVRPSDDEIKCHQFLARFGVMCCFDYFLLLYSFTKRIIYGKVYMYMYPKEN